MTPEQTFLENLTLIERVIAFVCGRHHLLGADAEDFGSSVKLKLIDHDYAILGQFEGRSSLPTFLTTVIIRLHRDQRVHVQGKWRPSAVARREGAHAELLEALLVRDHRPLEEACRLVRQRFPETVEAELRAIESRLPRRALRASESGSLAISELFAVDGGPTPEEALVERERQQLRQEASRRLTAAIEKLAPEDCVLLKMRYADGLKVSVIARMLQANQKTLYRRLGRIAESLRRDLVEAGYTEDLIRDLLQGGEGFDIPFSKDGGISPIRPSTDLDALDVAE